MARAPTHFDDIDVEARRPSIPAILLQTAVAVLMALATVLGLGALLLHG
jgi:hypothetical protein